MYVRVCLGVRAQFLTLASNPPSPRTVEGKEEGEGGQSSETPTGRVEANALLSFSSQGVREHGPRAKDVQRRR